MQATDLQLIESSRKGDHTAFGKLVDRYRDMIYGLGYHLTGDFEEARDLAQETFIQAYLKLGQLRNPEKFAGWLRRIEVNLYRSRSRTPKIPTVPLEEAGDEAMAARQTSEIEVVVQEALGKLRKPERLALTLHYINGYTQSEIGDFLGVTPMVVKARLARARQHLKKEIMAMVEDTFDKKKLPEDFAQKTIEEAERRYQLAWDIHRDGDTKKAVKTMLAMLDEEIPVGVRVRLHNNLGSFFHDRLGDPAKGREHLRQAAEAAEKDAAEHLGFFHWRVYAAVALQDEEWAEVLRAEHILGKAPTDFERRNLHVILSAAKANLGRQEEALRHLEEAAKSSAEPPNADRWPFAKQTPESTADPLDFVRKNEAKYFASLMDNAKFKKIIGGPR